MEDKREVSPELNAGPVLVHATNKLMMDDIDWRWSQCDPALAPLLEALLREADAWDIRLLDYPDQFTIAFLYDETSIDTNMLVEQKLMELEVSHSNVSALVISADEFGRRDKYAMVRLSWCVPPGTKIEDEPE